MRLANCIYVVNLLAAVGAYGAQGDDLFLIANPPGNEVRIFVLTELGLDQIDAYCEGESILAGSVTGDFGRKLIVMNCPKQAGRPAVIWLDGFGRGKRIIRFDEKVTGGWFAPTPVLLDLPGHGIVARLLYSQSRLDDLARELGFFRFMGATISPTKGPVVFDLKPDDQQYIVRHGSHGGEGGGGDISPITVGPGGVLQISATRQVGDSMTTPTRQLGLGVAVAKEEADELRLRPKGILHVKNDHGLVITFERDERKRGSGRTVGSARVSVYDRKREAWRAFEVPGSMPRVRGFQDWIAVIACDEVESGADNPGIPGDLPAARTEWLRSYEYFPGLVILWNIHTGQRIDLRTNVADTEVVGVEGETAYYRVNEELFAAPINAAGLGAAVRIAKDDAIYGVHFAMLGRR